MMVWLRALTHAAIPAMTALIALADERLGIAGLEILPARRLDTHHGTVVRWGMTEAAVGVGGASWSLARGGIEGGSTVETGRHDEEEFGDGIGGD
jgi:hypothetical protein